MDWFPLTNSLRIAVISTAITFLLGIVFAHYIAKLPRVLKGVLDCLLTLPMVLPPTVVGFFLLKTIGPKGPVGMLAAGVTDQKLVMQWYSAIFATVIVTLPLMYRTARGAFENFDEDLADAARSLGLNNIKVFFFIKLPVCKQGILAGMVLAFARAIGEYGATSMVAGYIPGRTATISTTVYQLWREGNDMLAYKWVMVNLAISFVVIVTVNLLEQSKKSRESQRFARHRERKTEYDSHRQRDAKRDGWLKRLWRRLLGRIRG